MFALPDHRIVVLHGRDAVAFAHAQFMSDVAALADGHWQWSGWLTPKGRVVALFALLRRDGETLWLVLQDADAAEFAQRLRRFVFRSKVAIDVPAELRAAGTFEAPPHATGAQAGPLHADVVSLDLGGDGGPRTLLLGAAAEAGGDADGAARWAAYDLAHGLPRLQAGQAEQWTPQQLSLDRLRAYSVRKGCYPGQEIVARTHFLGQAKRGLALLEADAALVPGTPVLDGERAFGTVASAASAGGRHLALAVVPLDAAPSAPMAAGAPLRPVALREGLAR